MRLTSARERSAKLGSSSSPAPPGSNSPKRHPPVPKPAPPRGRKKKLNASSKMIGFLLSLLVSSRVGRSLPIVDPDDARAKCVWAKTEGLRGSLRVGGEGLRRGCKGVTIQSYSLFVISGVGTCGNGTGYCLLGMDCRLNQDFEPDPAGHCSGLRTAFTPSAHFSCCTSPLDRNELGGGGKRPHQKKPKPPLPSPPGAPMSPPPAVSGSEPLNGINTQHPQPIRPDRFKPSEPYNPVGLEERPTVSPGLPAVPSLPAASSHKPPASFITGQEPLNGMDTLQLQPLPPDRFKPSEPLLPVTNGPLKPVDPTELPGSLAVPPLVQQAGQVFNRPQPPGQVFMRPPQFSTSGSQQQEISSSSPQQPPEVIFRPQYPVQAFRPTFSGLGQQELPLSVTLEIKPKKPTHTIDNLNTQVSANVNESSGSLESEPPEPVQLGSMSTTQQPTSLKVNEKGTETWSTEQSAPSVQQTITRPPDPEPIEQVSSGENAEENSVDWELKSSGNNTSTGLPRTDYCPPCHSQTLFTLPGQPLPLCLGTHLRQGWVLTSGSCALKIFRVGMIKVVGRYLQDPETAVQVKTIAVHEDYRPFTSNILHPEPNNIGLVLLSGMPKNACYPCIPDKEENFAGKLCSSTSNSTALSIKMTKRGNISSDEVCESLVETMRGEGTEEFYTVACDRSDTRYNAEDEEGGESGRGLMCRGYIAGVETGSGTGLAVFTRVSDFYQWITQNMMQDTRQDFETVGGF